MNNVYNNNFYIFPKDDFTNYQTQDNIIVKKNVFDIPLNDFLKKNKKNKKLSGMKIKMKIKKVEKNDGETIQINNFNGLKKYQYLTTPLDFIIKNTTTNSISKGIVKEKGFRFYPDMGISLRDQNAETILKNFGKIAKLKNEKYKITIILKNKDTDTDMDTFCVNI